MNHRAWIWTLLPIFAAASGIIYWKSSPSSPASTPDSRKELDAIRSEIEILKARNTAGRVYAAQAEERHEPEYQAGAPADLSARPTRTTDGHQARSEPLDTRTQEQREADDIAANVEFATFLDNRFDDERPDSSWSIQAAREVKSAVSGALPAGSSLGTIECRTNLCRIETTHESIDAFKAYVDTAYLSRDKKTWDSGVNALVTARTPSSVTAVTYMAREGRSMPMPDATER
jgi:hypothetical protein